MNRKKVILSILMMVFLIAVGFVLPHLFKEKRGEKPASSAPTKEETTDTEQSSSKTALTFLDFSALQNFFSKGQIETLCQELQTYLTDTGNTSITSVQFLEDKTTYPNASDIGFSFRLSDDSVLPVYYSSSIGRFFYIRKMKCALPLLPMKMVLLLRKKKRFLSVITVLRKPKHLRQLFYLPHEF